MERERAFAADASHQIRTPLTALRLGLERALLAPDADLTEAVQVALERIDRVESTVDELMARARDTPAPSPSAPAPRPRAASPSRFRTRDRASTRPRWRRRSAAATPGRAGPGSAWRWPAAWPSRSGAAW